MSKLTLDEAIKHCLEVAEKHERHAKILKKRLLGSGLDTVDYCLQCAADHRQLAEWLTELLQRREWCAQYEVEQISNLEQYDMLSREYEILNERYKEAVKLLKVAVEDIHELLCDKKNLDGNGQSCNICSYIEWCPCCKECTIREDLRNWRYADEALKLLNDEK